MYNADNVFAKILRKEVPAKVVFENDFVLAFHDINPKACVHVLVIPRGEYVSFSDFAKNGKNVDVFFKTVREIAEDILKLKSYKVLTNNGEGAGQEVFHFHVHILA
jgi:histidine triad (HIT) family protein